MCSAMPENRASATTQRTLGPRHNPKGQAGLGQGGDIQILNNHAILHSRTEFEDWPEPERKRHLLRLLMFTPAFADVPDHYRTIYATARDWRDHPRPPAAPSPIAAE